MSLTGGHLDALLAAGATAEQIVALIKADMAAREARTARQIPWERLRLLAFQRDGDKCGWCGCEDGPFEVDHIVARAKGGENILENVIVSCRSCNRAKKDRDEGEWSDLHARRVKDRERKRLQRIRDKSRDNRDTSHATRDPSPNERDNLTPTRERKTEPKGSSKSSNGTRLPSGWEPKPLTGKTLEMVTAWPAGMIERELAKFKDHWLKTPGTRGRSLDWDASYRNWLRNADERKPRNERSNNSPTEAFTRVFGQC